MTLTSPDHVPLSALLDVSQVQNAAQALDLLDQLLSRPPEEGLSALVNLNVGPLVLTPGLVNKIRQTVSRRGYRLEAMFSTVPQTQQAALTEGLYVKAQPLIPSAALLRQRQGHHTEMGEEEDGEVEGMPTRAKAPSPHLPDIASTQMLEEQQRLLNTPTLLIKRSLRSGKILKHDGHVVLVGDIHAGSELLATGDVLVWGEIRGIVHAGANGNPLAEIRAMRIEALQLRIADFIARRPDKTYYHKPNDLSQGILPEVARVIEGEIMVYKDRFERNTIGLIS